MCLRSVTQARTVRVFAQEEAEVERFDGLLAATYRLANRAAWLQGVTDGALAMDAGIKGLVVTTLGLHVEAGAFVTGHLSIPAEAVSMSEVSSASLYPVGLCRSV